MTFQKGHTTSDGVRRKIGDASKGRKAFLGRKHTEEAKKRISTKLRGVPLSMERRLHMSTAHIGKVHTDDVKKKISESKKGKKRQRFSKEWINNMSKARKGKHNKGAFKKRNTPWSKGLHLPVEMIRFGERNPSWKGGSRLAEARHRNKRLNKGFLLIVANNPYNEQIDYHHIAPDLPYVIPCPKRIHQMFNGNDSNHFNNVNAMLGVRFEI